MRQARHSLKELKKNWKKRLILWSAYILTIVYTLLPDPSLTKILIAIILFLLLIPIDEKIKEGYYFKKEDIPKLLTHEFILVITILLLPLIIIARGVKNVRKRITKNR